MADEDDRKWLPPTDPDDDKPGDTLPGVPGSFSGGPDVPGSGLSSGDPLAGADPFGGGGQSSGGGQTGGSGGLWSSQPGQGSTPPPSQGWGAPSEAAPPSPGGQWGPPPVQPPQGNQWGPPPGEQPGGQWGAAPGQETFAPYQHQTSGTNGKAVAAFILALVGLILCPLICPVLALIFGYQARGDIDRSGGREGGRGLAVAGIVIGWIGIAWTVVIILLAVLGVLAEDSFDTDEDSIGRPAVVLVQPR